MVTAQDDKKEVRNNVKEICSQTFDKIRKRFGNLE